MSDDTAQPESNEQHIEIHDYIIIKDLAAALRTPSFRIIKDLMEFGFFETINGKIDFKTASLVCTRYGFTAHKIP